MTTTTSRIARALALSTAAAVSPAYAQTFEGTEATSGPLEGGEQTFRDNSVLNASFGGDRDSGDGYTISGGYQYFHDNSVLNVLAENAFAGGLQHFYDDSVLNVLVENAEVTGGRISFHNNSVVNASAGNAIRGSWEFRDNNVLNATAENAINNVWQNFRDASALNASAERAISGGTQRFQGSSALNATASNAVSAGSQMFYGASTLNASASDAVTGGIQVFEESSTLNATAENAISGGQQRFRGSSTLNARAENAINGGEQEFSDTSVLNASAEAAVVNGVQRFHDASTLNANAPGAISGGAQIFDGESVLNATTENAISGGAQVFDGSNVLNALAEHSISAGTQTLRGTSVLNAAVENAVSGVVQRVYEDSVVNAMAPNAIDRVIQRLDENGTLNVLADNALSTSTDLWFTDRWFGTEHGPGGTLSLNGFDTTVGRVSSVDVMGGASPRGNGGRILNGGTDDSVLTVNTSELSPARYIGAIEDGGEGSLELVVSGGELTLTGAVSHSGGTTVTAGALILEGAKNYTGGTKLLGGVLSASQDTSLGAASGELAFDGGTLRVIGTDFTSTDRAITLGAAGGVLDIADAGNILHVSQNIAGNGDLVKRGDGALRLTGNNEYGNTRVEAGGVFGNTSSIPGNILLDGAAASLTFNDSGNAAYSGAISGNGQFSLNGDGRVLLTGDSSGFAGNTSVRAGTLLVGDAAGNGALGGSLDVLSGAALGGSGTVGSGSGSLLTVASGGTLAPGNSIGTLTVDGDLVFEAGSHFVVEVNPQGTESDLVAVTGKATLNGGAVAHIGAHGEYKPRATYTILSADGTLSGAFSGVASDFAFLTPELVYDYGDSRVDLVLERNDRDFASVAESPNQVAVAEGIDSIGPEAGHAVYDAVAQLADDDQVIRASFDALSGEAHASVKTTMIEDSRFIRNAANDRVRAAFSTVGASDAPVLAYGANDANQLVAADHAKPVFWIHHFGSWGSMDGNGNATTLDRDIKGLLIGADGQVGDWRLGLLAGNTRSDFKAKGRASSGSSDSYHLGLYGGTKWDDIALRTGAAYSWHNIETRHTVAIPGFNDRLTGDYSARTFQVFGELAHDVSLGTETRLEPFANLAHVRQHGNGFTEKGGAAALSAATDTANVTFTTLGLRGEHSVTVGALEPTFKGMLGWRHAFGDTTPTTTQNFSGGDAFTIAGLPVARNSAVAEAGADLKLTSDVSLGLSYTGLFGSDTADHGFRANLSVRF